MLADTIESAVRSLSELTPGRIEAVVHNMAMKRLQDGQFDECDLTLRELSRIEASLSKSLAAHHHGRVAYPKAPDEPLDDQQQSQPAAAQAATFRPFPPCIATARSSGYPASSEVAVWHFSNAFSRTRQTCIGREASWPDIRLPLNSHEGPRKGSHEHQTLSVRLAIGR